MREHSFATVVSQGEDGAPFASHLPLTVRMDEKGKAALVGHMARANPQWRAFAPGRAVLVIFQGPHGYISPSWYVNEPSVPTWNYTAVHVYGVPVVQDSEEKVAEIVEDAVAEYEAGFENPWKLDLPVEFRRKLLAAIVGFEIPVTRIEGKFKLGQNRPPEDVTGASERLEASGSEAGRELARLMREAGGSDRSTSNQ